MVGASVCVTYQQLFLWVREVCRYDDARFIQTAAAQVAARSHKHVLSDADSVLRDCVLGVEVNFHVASSVFM